MRIDVSDSKTPHKLTKVFDQNGDAVKLVQWLDDETHEVELVETGEDGKPLVDDFNTDHAKVRTKVYEVEGWTYRIDGADPLPV